MSNFGPMKSPTIPGVPTLPQGEPIGRYGTYLQAQRAVDFLSDNHFPVQIVTIVGTGLQMVERVTGRLTYARVAVSGLGSGAWLGLFMGSVMYLFSQTTSTTVFAVVGLGAGFGLIFGVISFSMARGRRDFTSTSQIVATEYVILCLVEKASAARDLLQSLPGGTGGIGGAPRPSIAPISGFGEPPMPGESRHDGPAPEALVPTGPTYGEMMAKRRQEERARSEEAEPEKVAPEKARSEEVKSEEVKSEKVPAAESGQG
jgi:hypothetical protein